MPEHAPGAPVAARAAARARRCPSRPPTRRTDPEHEALLADSVGLALLVVLDTLSPAERVAFVLHDVFAIPFDEIAPIVDRSTAGDPPAGKPRPRAASSGRTRTLQAGPAPPGQARRRLPRPPPATATSSALLALLDPDVVLRADDRAVELGAATADPRGAEPVGAFLRRARGARPALLDGAPAAVWIPAARCAWSTTSPPARTGSRPSTSSPTRTDSGGWTWSFPRCRDGQARALAFSRSNSAWSMVPASSSCLARVIWSVGGASPVVATFRT